MENTWVAPDHSLVKIILKPGFGFEGPQEGATCCFDIQEDKEELLKSFKDKTIILGEADSLISFYFEIAIKAMKEEEECELYFSKKALSGKNLEHRCKIESKSKSVRVAHTKKQDNENVNINTEDEKRAQPEAVELETLTSEPVPSASSSKNVSLEEVSEESIKIDSEESIEHEEINPEVTPSPLSPEEEPKLEETPAHAREPSLDETPAPARELSLEEVPAPDYACDVEKSACEEQKRSSKCYPENFVFVVKEYIKVKLSLTSYTREPEIWEMSITEKWRRFHHHKNRGVELYTQKQYYWSFRRFSIAIKHLISLQYEIPPEDQNEQGMEIKSFKMSCYLNLAACQLKHRNYEHAIINCTKALEIDPLNPKALYRRGTGYIHVQEYERAQTDLDRALEIEPNRLAIQNQLKVLRNSVLKLNQYYANCMKKMFS